MNSQNTELLAGKRKHLLQVLAMASNYCARHLFIECNVSGLPLHALDEIGNELIDLFLDRVEEVKKKSPPDEGATATGGPVRKRRQFSRQ